MKILSLDECQRDLAALDAADRLTANMKVEIDRFKEMDTGAAHEKSHGNVDEWQPFTGGVRASR